MSLAGGVGGSSGAGVAGDNYVWIGPSGGAWGVASDWRDDTALQNPALTAPGVNDAVTINSINGSLSVSGSGSVASLTIAAFPWTGNAITLAGQFTTGTLTTTGTAEIDLGAGDTLSVIGEADINFVEGALKVDGAGSQFTVGGPLSVEESLLTVANGGYLRASSLSLGGALQGAYGLTVDSTSTVEIGAVGGAASGWLTIDSGATATLLGFSPLSAASILNKGSIADTTSNITATATFDNEGTLTVGGNLFVLQAASIVDNGVITLNGVGATLTGAVTGTGQINLNGGTLAPQTVGSGVTIQFGATPAILQLSAASLGPNNTFGAHITGFGPNDAIDYAGTVTSATWANNVLTLHDGGSVVATVALAGAYAGDNFLTVSLGRNAFSTDPAAVETQISLAAGGDTPTAPAGSNDGENFTWAGSVAGSWDATANWTPSSIAPGAKDNVSIAGAGAGAVQVVTGIGAAATLTLDGGLVLDGHFTVGTLTASLDSTGRLVVIDGTLSVSGNVIVPGEPNVPPIADPGGGSGIVATIWGGSGPEDGFVVGGAGSQFTVAGLLTVNGGGLTATGGAVVRAGALSAIGDTHPQILSVDATSSLEVGAAGGAAQGAITVDAGATFVEGATTIEAASLINRGMFVDQADATFLVIPNVNAPPPWGVAVQSLLNYGVMQLGVGLGQFGNTAATVTASTFLNDGTLIVDSGHAKITGSITGDGTIQLIAGSLSVGAVAAGLTTHFENATQLYLTSGAMFASTIVGFGAGDVINIQGAATSASYANGVLTLLNGQTAVAYLHLAGDYGGASFSVTSGQGWSEVQVANANPLALHDYNDAGRSDVLMENSSGSVVVGQVAGGVLHYTGVASLGPEWKFVGSGDFLGDGHADALIENAAGSVFIADMVSGHGVYTPVVSLGAEWSFHAAGDFLGDGKTDFLIENTSGAVDLGEMDAGGHVGFTQIAALGPEWRFEGAGDFFGDGRADFLMENASGSVVVGQVVAGQAVYSAVASLGPEWKFVGTGDFLGDGRDDFLIENSAGAVVAGEIGSGGQAAYTTLTSLGPEWKFVGTGDFLGEGHAQFMIENTAGAVFIGDETSGQTHFTLVGAIGSEWAFH